jgi:hypothetical protein
MSVERGGEIPAWIPGIPDWVPNGVKSIALATEFGGEVRKRLATDPRMRAVWIELKRACRDSDKKNPDSTRTALEGFDPLHHLRTWSIPHYGVHDQICAAFFSYAALELGVRRHCWTRADAKKIAKRWDEAAGLCESIAYGEVSPAFDEDFRKHAAAIIPYLRKHGKLLKEEGRLVNLGQCDAPYIIGSRGSGVRGDNEIRGKARALAIATQQLFSKCLYQTLVTVIAVGLNLEKRPE